MTAPLRENPAAPRTRATHSLSVRPSLHSLPLKAPSLSSGPLDARPRGHLQGSLDRAPVNGQQRITIWQAGFLGISPYVLQREMRLIQARGGAIEAEQLAVEISPRTRLFCTSWVNSFSGYAIDVDGLGQVCRNNHVIFVLNAAQGLGARVLDVQASPVDAVTCCGYKWLCGPYATGFCWLTPALRESLTIRHAYWLTMQSGKPLEKMRDYSMRSDLGARAWDSSALRTS